MARSSAEKPEDLFRLHEEYNLRPHQEQALNDVVAGFEKYDRGRLIMACGTGKTFTALRITEVIAGEGGRASILCHPSHSFNSPYENGQSTG